MRSLFVSSRSEKENKLPFSLARLAINTKEARWISQEKYGGGRPFLFWIDVLRHALGYPVAYIIGNIPFLSATIDLSYKPFIPREDTAFWVEQALQKIHTQSPYGKDLKIVDIFSGSGAIGITAAKSLPEAQIFFIEKTPRFIKQIKKNIALNALRGRAHVIPHYDLSKCTQQFDYIFANPPYLSARKLRNIQLSVLLWEPLEALFSPNNGMRHIKELLSFLPKILKKEGILFLEHDPWQAEEIRTLCEKMGFRAQSHVDQYENIRMTSIIYPF